MTISHNTFLSVSVQVGLTVFVHYRLVAYAAIVLEDPINEWGKDYNRDFFIVAKMYHSATSRMKKILFQAIKSMFWFNMLVLEKIEMNLCHLFVSHFLNHVKVSATGTFLMLFIIIWINTCCIRYLLNIKMKW